jgi:hypothetical protein
MAAPELTAARGPRRRPAWLFLVLGLAAACSSGSGGPVAPGGELALLILCPVCGVGTYTIEAGDNAQMTVRATSVETGEEVTCAQGAWSSDNEAVARVVGFGKTGTVTGMAPGTARIRVVLTCGVFGSATVEEEVLVVAGA